MRSELELSDLKTETNARRLYEDGCSLMKHGRFELALQYVERSIALDKSEATPSVLRNIAWLAYNLEQWDKAKKNYELARDGYTALSPKPHVAEYRELRINDCKRRLQEIRDKAA